MLFSRRTFVAGLAAAGVVAALPASSADRAASPAATLPPGAKGYLRVDALCYATQGITADVVERALKGGLSAAVFDLDVYPRENVGALRALTQWNERFFAPDANVLAVRQAADFDRAKQAGQLGIVLACQDANILGVPQCDFRAMLRLFHTLGLRVLQLTHNERTPWGDSFMEKRDGGLSRAGEQLVQAMNALGLVVDLSHCSRQTLLDAVALSQRPCAVTHAGCAALAPTARNKSDDEIRALGKAGGFFGVYNMTTWLTAGPAASLATVLDHIDHAVQLIGPAQVGFGSDGGLDQLDAAAELVRMSAVQQKHQGQPSAEWPVQHVRVPELNAPSRLSALAEGLARRGYSNEHVNGITGGNFVRLFQRVCG